MRLGDHFKDVTGLIKIKKVDCSDAQLLYLYRLSSEYILKPHAPVYMHSLQFHRVFDL